MFTEVRHRLPSIGPWVESCYGVASVLNFGGGSILSTTGVHQGDPLGSLLFSATLQPVVEKLEEVEDLLQNTWFLDDGQLLGTREALVKAWDILVKEGVPRGLHLSHEKSLVYCPEHDLQDRDPLGRGVSRVKKEGIKLLGAPVGLRHTRRRSWRRGSSQYRLYWTVFTPWTTPTWSAPSSGADFPSQSLATA